MRTPDFKYDPYGNLVEDRDKEIKEIVYNHMNLPIKILIGSDSKIKYIYDAAGTKLKKIVTEGSAEKITEYVDGFIYFEGNLDFFPTAEGYVQVKQDREQYDYQYVYNYTDIWGNVRLSYSDLDLNGAIDPNTEILKERNYYPGGLLHKGYNNVVRGTESNYKQFQGQEWTEDLGLNVHEWRYRIGDPAILRFWQVDPLAEDYVYNSTYAFAENKLGMGIELEGAEIYTWAQQAAVEDAAVNPNGVGAHALGISQGLANTVTGIWDAVANPGQTLKGMANMLVAGASQGNPASMLAMDNALGTESFGTSAAMGQALDGAVNDVVSGNGIERGTVIGEVIGAVVGTKGANAALKGVSTASKVTKVSSNVKKALNTLNDIKASGGQVKMNNLKTGQELNMTLTQGSNKLNVRVETHVVPKKFGGNGTTPQRHLNVETVPAKRNTLPNKGHKILENQ